MSTGKTQERAKDAEDYCYFHCASGYAPLRKLLRMSGGIPRAPWPHRAYKRSTIPSPPVADIGYGWAFFLLGLFGFAMMWW